MPTKTHADELIGASEAADHLTGPGRSRTQALSLVNRFETKGMISGIRRNPGARGTAGEREFHPHSIAILAVLAAVSDELNLRDKADLLPLAHKLDNPENGSKKKLIADVLENIAAGGNPTLVTALFFNKETRDICICYQVTFEEPQALPPPPGREGFVVRWQAGLALEQVLASFMEA